MDSKILSKLVGISQSAMIKNGNLNESVQALSNFDKEAQRKSSESRKRINKESSSNKKFRKLNAQQQQMAEVQRDIRLDLIAEFAAKNNISPAELAELAEKVVEEDSKTAEIIDEEMEEASTSAGKSNSKKPERKYATKPKGATNKPGKNKDKNKEKESVPVEAPKIISKPPPIITKRIHPVLFDKDLEESGVNYQLKSGNRLAIKCPTKEVHAKAMKLLQEEKPGGHSYTPKERKKTVLVLKGLDECFSDEEIINSLKEQTGVVVEAKRMTTPHSKNNNYQLTNFLVTTTENDKNKLLKVFSINKQIIEWERLKKKGLTQCYNCQRFGHIAEWCLFAYRCVKCKGNHKPKQCKRVGKSDSKPYCCNCDKEGHPASFGGCPKAVELMVKVEENKAKKQETRDQINERRLMIDRALVTPGVTYAAAAKIKMTNKGAQKQAPTTSEGNIGFIGAECKRLFNTDFFRLLEKSREFVPKYKDLKSDEAKQMALMDFMSKL